VIIQGNYLGHKTVMEPKGIIHEGIITSTLAGGVFVGAG
jgi:hypothetical protein